mmetsp:Transcript_110142/g.322259  ORF Transcript_110142/g.322259 Transcript_110142/m.322259 type:complete len:275 (+) Transcript_110142:1376-2200(+)
MVDSAEHAPRKPHRRPRALWQLPLAGPRRRRLGAAASMGQLVAPACALGPGPRLGGALPDALRARLREHQRPPHHHPVLDLPRQRPWPGPRRAAAGGHGLATGLRRPAHGDAGAAALPGPGRREPRVRGLGAAGLPQAPALPQRPHPLPPSGGGRGAPLPPVCEQGGRLPGPARLPHRVDLRNHEGLRAVGHPAHGRAVDARRALDRELQADLCRGRHLLAAHAVRGRGLPGLLHVLHAPARRGRSGVLEGAVGCGRRRRTRRHECHAAEPAWR